MKVSQPDIWWTDRTRSTRPNVIWILGDQFRAQALACNGDPNSRSPKYRFERAFRRSGHRSRDLAP
jgi:hypothetical protein